MAPTRRSPRVAGKNVDRITCSGAARPVEETVDAQALEGGRVEIAADDRGCHLLPVVTTAIHRLSHPGESGEPPGPEDGHLGHLAALDRVPAQLLSLRDEVLGIEHVDRPELGPHGNRVHVGVVPGCRHHGRTLVSKHRGDHEALTLAYPGHSEGQDVVLRLGEQPGAGGDVYSKRHGLTRCGGTAPVDGGGVSFDGLASHATLDLGPSDLGGASTRTAERPLGPTDQPKGHDCGGHEEQLGDGQRRPHGDRPRQKGPGPRAPGQPRITGVAPQVEERRGPCADATGDDVVGAEGERGQLAGEVGGHALTDDESDHDQEHQERAIEGGLGLGLVHGDARFMGWDRSRRTRAARASGEDAPRGSSAVTDGTGSGDPDGGVRCHRRPPRAEGDDRGQGVRIVDRLGRRHQAAAD